MRVGKKGEDELEASTVVELADLLILTLLDRGIWGLLGPYLNNILFIKNIPLPPLTLTTYIAKQDQARPRPNLHGPLKYDDPSLDPCFF